VGAKASQALVDELEGSVGAQKRCVAAEWSAAEAASAAHAVATQRAAVTAQHGASARVAAARAAEQARTARAAATSAAEHVDALERAAGLAHESAETQARPPTELGTHTVTVASALALRWCPLFDAMIAQLQPAADAEHAAALAVLHARRDAAARAKAAVGEAERAYVSAATAVCAWRREPETRGVMRIGVMLIACC
jgi:hypothetical protein